MSWLIRRNGRVFPAPWGEQSRHKGGDGGGAGAGDPGAGPGSQGFGGEPTGGGMTEFGGGRDIFGGTNPALMGSAEAAVTPTGVSGSPGSGLPSLAGKKSMGNFIGTVLGAASPFPGGSLAGGLLGRAIQGAAPMSASERGAAQGGGPNPAGAGGQGNAGAGGQDQGTQAMPSVAAPMWGSGQAPPSLAPPAPSPTTVLAQNLAALDPTQLATALGGNAEDALDSAKEMVMRLKLFQHALTRASRVPQRAA